MFNLQMKELIKTLDALESGDELAELIASGAKIPIVVTGSSMRPFLRNKRDDCDQKLT